MKTKISNTIEAGDMVHHHKRLWLVETMQAGRPCSIQCAMYDAEAVPGAHLVENVSLQIK